MRRAESWLLAAALFLPGCTTVFFTGHRVDPVLLEGLVVGETSPAQARRWLGEPDVETENRFESTVVLEYHHFRVTEVSTVVFARRAMAGDMLKLSFRYGRFTGYAVVDQQNRLLSQGRGKSASPDERSVP